MTTYQNMKRTFDVLCSLYLIVLFSPLLLAIGILVRLTSKGPVIYKQKRMGHRGRVFTIYKFRTMQNGMERYLDLVKRGDPRVTWIGSFLRTMHLDELPQLFNVIVGDMSMVGPRPDELRIALYLKERVRGYHECLEMVPGLTGLSQLVGREKVNRLGRRFEVWLHRHYRKRRSLAYDFKILALTVPHVLRQRGV